jgi:hypothetical protein
MAGDMKERLTSGQEDMFRNKSAFCIIFTHLSGIRNLAQHHEYLFEQAF